MHVPAIANGLGARVLGRLLPLVICLALVSCATPGQSPDPVSPSGALALTSDAFSYGQPIPREYTCDGDDLSPPLAWTGVPEGTQSLAIICDDPDAPLGTWVHWVVYDLPPDVAALEAGIEPSEYLPAGGIHGVNGWRNLGYGGPCPPSGSHRYHFALCALDTVLALDPGESKKDVLRAMEGHVLAQTELMGTYTR